eukprot:m51a1_g1551 putative serine-threonine protein (972) ;mRNA; f:41-3687
MTAADRWALPDGTSALCAAAVRSGAFVAVLWAQSRAGAHLALVRTSNSSLASSALGGVNVSVAAACAGAQVAADTALFCGDTGQCTAVAVGESGAPSAQRSPFVAFAPESLGGAELSVDLAAVGRPGHAVLASVSAGREVRAQGLHVSGGSVVSSTPRVLLGEADEVRVSVAAVGQTSLAVVSFLTNSSAVVVLFDGVEGRVVASARSDVDVDLATGGYSAVSWSPSAGFGTLYAYLGDGANRSWQMARIDVRANSSYSAKRAASGSALWVSSWSSVAGLRSVGAATVLAASNADDSLLVTGQLAWSVALCSSSCMVCNASRVCATCATGLAGAACDSCATGYVNYPNCTFDVSNLSSSSRNSTDTAGDGGGGMSSRDKAIYVCIGLAVALALVACAGLFGWLASRGDKDEERYRRPRRTNSGSRFNLPASPKGDPEAGIENIEDPSMPLLSAAPVVPGDEVPQLSVPPVVNDSKLADLFALPLQLPMDSFHFNLGGQPAPVRVPVVQDFSIPNTTSRKYAYAFILPGRPLGEKYTINFTPQRGIVQPGEFANIRVELMFLCTTKIQEEIAFIVSTGKGDLKLRQHSYVHLKLESKQSFYLDYDELKFVVPPIGQGGEGTVYQGTLRGSDVAIKFLKNQVTGPEAQTVAEGFEKEVNQMENLRSPNIVAFVGAVVMPGKMCLVTEFFDMGSLAVVLSKFNMEVPLKLKFAIDIVKGLQFLAESHILHRCVKPSNMMVSSMSIDAAVNCKVGDWASTRDAALFAAQFSRALGSPSYLAPEVIKGAPYAHSADVYSFGVLLYELFTEIQPYNSEKFQNPWEITNWVCAGNRLDIPGPDVCPPAIADLIGRCWNQTIETRPSYRQIITELQALLDSLRPSASRSYFTTKTKGNYISGQMLKVLQVPQSRSRFSTPRASATLDKPVADADSSEPEEIDFDQLKAAIENPEMAMAPSASPLSDVDSDTGSDITPIA